MVLATTLGYPRIGPKRELKKALEKYWSGAISEADLDEASRTIRQDNWRLQKEAGIDHIPSNEFSLYDHVLDTAAMVGAVPERFAWDDRPCRSDHIFCDGAGCAGETFRRRR